MICSIEYDYAVCVCVCVLPRPSLQCTIQRCINPWLSMIPQMFMHEIIRISCLSVVSRAPSQSHVGNGNDLMESA